MEIMLILLPLGSNLSDLNGGTSGQTFSLHFGLGSHSLFYNKRLTSSYTVASTNSKIERTAFFQAFDFQIGFVGCRNCAHLFPRFLSNFTSFYKIFWDRRTSIIFGRIPSENKEIVIFPFNTSRTLIKKHNYGFFRQINFTKNNTHQQDYMNKKHTVFSWNQFHENVRENDFTKKNTHTLVEARVYLSCSK